MAIYKLTDPKNTTLTIPLSGVSKDLDRQKIKDDLIETMKHYNGIGLSANQCGILERVFVMYGDFQKREAIACFNPKIIYSSVDTVIMDDGCLTYPVLWLKVKRPAAIEVEYEDENGKEWKHKLDGLDARVYLHEMDHMDGTDFTKRVSKLRLDMAKKRRAKQQKKLLDISKNT